ncbi:MAG: hypothetical protein HPY60_02650 [Candidatus Methanofastidiosum sp.]|nr:hypothetical protein [Methanofastidiosum sp.]NYT03727.1 hypothetical protein [Candidatus Methanofastidiosa archaeon]
MSIKTPKTLREKTRYVSFKIEGGKDFKREDLVKAIWNTAIDFLGEFGASEIGLWVKDYDESRRYGIIESNIKSLYKAIFILSLTKSVGKEKVNILPLYVSGTIKGLEKNIKSNVN